MMVVIFSKWKDVFILYIAFVFFFQFFFFKKKPWVYQKRNGHDAVFDKILFRLPVRMSNSSFLARITSRMTSLLLFTSNYHTTKNAGKIINQNQVNLWFTTVLNQSTNLKVPILNILLFGEKGNISFFRIR